MNQLGVIIAAADACNPYLAKAGCLWKSVACERASVALGILDGRRIRQILCACDLVDEIERCIVFECTRSPYPHCFDSLRRAQA